MTICDICGKDYAGNSYDTSKSACSMGCAREISQSKASGDGSTKSNSAFNVAGFEMDEIEKQFAQKKKLKTKRILTIVFIILSGVYIYWQDYGFTHHQCNERCHANFSGMKNWAACAVKCDQHYGITPY